MPSAYGRIRRAILCLTPILLTAVSAHAQEATVNQPTVETQRRQHRSTYIAFYTGRTSAASSDLHLIQPQLGTDVTYHDVDYEGKPQTGSPYYGFKAGYYFPKAPRVGLELEFNHAKMYARVGESKLLTGTWQGQAVNGVERMADKVSEYRITNGINSFTLNLLYRVPISVSDKYPDGRFQPYVGGGPQYTVLYSINTVAGLEAKEKYHPNGWGYQLLGGVRYLIHPHLGAFVEGKYQHGDAVSLIADQDANDGGRGVTDIRIAHFAGGLFYQF